MADWAAQGIRFAYFPDDLDNYPPWVAAHGLVAPYGECQCGCGESTTTTTKRDGKGEVLRLDHKRCLPCHKASKQTAEELFWNHITRNQFDTDECWTWTGKIHSQGYGVFTYRGKEIYAHRFSFAIHNEPVPEKMHVLHKCDNPPCSNPKHLFPGTNADNVADAVAKNRNVRGERVGTAKLTVDMVRKIKDELLRGDISKDKIGERYSVSGAAIRKIAKGQTWAHISLHSEQKGETCQIGQPQV